MLIRHKCIRKGGTEVILGKGKDARIYHFAPLDPKNAPDEDHCCDVENQQDVATLLAIPEGYEVHPKYLKSGGHKPAPTKEASMKGSVSGQGEPAPATISSASSQPAGDDYDAWDKDALIAEIARRTGKKPHPTTSTKKLSKQLRELDKKK